MPYEDESLANIVDWKVLIVHAALYEMSYFIFLLNESNNTFEMSK